MKLPLLFTAFILVMAAIPKVAPAPDKVDTVRGLPIEVSAERPFRMPLYPLPAVIGFLTNAGLLVAMAVEDPAHTITGIGAAGALGIGYALFGKSEPEARAREAGASLLPSTRAP